MTRVGMVARADSGGLGNQTWEFWRHVRPAATVVMQFGPVARGTERIERYADLQPGQEVWHNPVSTVMDDASMEWLLSHCDVVFSAETFYREDFVEQATRRGVRTILQANPELYGGHGEPSELWVPTHWEIERMPAGTKWMQYPVALDRFEQRVRESATTFLHHVAPAMMDRNGTYIVLGALRHVTARIKMIIVANDPVPSMAAYRMPPNVDLQVISAESEHYWQCYPPEADVFVLPRRYAGMSMPMQEAMAAGMPVLTLDVEPQKSWPGTARIPVKLQTTARMAGGMFSVWDAKPQHLAAEIDRLASHNELVRTLSTEAIEHARSISWDVWRSRYIEALSSPALSTI